MEARGGIEPPMMVLQTIALPLGDRAIERMSPWTAKGLERKAFAVQSPALDYKLLPLTSVNGSEDAPPQTAVLGLPSFPPMGRSPPWRAPLPSPRTNPRGCH